MELPEPPRRLVLGGAAFTAVTGALEENLADIRSAEVPARSAGHG
ncbi:hypothetical protein [Dactylosporangium matsuzakiense]|nr:hypothetical protein [Dactylosporangium matsuzakiense]